MAANPASVGRGGWRFDNSYARLPPELFSRTGPVAVRRPALVVLNHALADSLGLDPAHLATEQSIAVFAGNELAPGSEPIAQAYAGHQFGNFTNLGDGRAILLGEQLTPDDRRYDIQLKGSGPTPYSRRGDGRAALGPMLREYIISEAMHGLGIPTTRSLAVVTTGEQVLRDEVLPGAVLTRVAASHLRVGTFEYVAALRDRALLEQLVDYTLRRHYPELDTIQTPALTLLDAVMERQAALIARWLCVGFVHGVMNTDNMTLSGETIDYGPCAFIDVYDPTAVFSSIDRRGRYAFANQPPIAQWNLARLAESLLPLMHAEQSAAVALAEQALDRFPELFQRRYLAGLRSKLGLLTEEADDVALANGFLDLLKGSAADFTNSFADLTRVAAGEVVDDALTATPQWAIWHAQWQARLNRQPQSAAEVAAVMGRSNPVVIARNHRVEEALRAAHDGDYAVMQDLLDVLAQPYEVTRRNEPYRAAPAPGGAPYRTFCGT
jgi:uncharacterized protein YdiU (UPF0061 family)